MSNIPRELKYTTTHEWVRLEEDGSATIGITDHAQELLGDLVYIELPENNTEIREGAEIGVVESVKAASDIYAPISGQITAVNEALNDTPELVNNDPYGDGWILRLKPDTQEEIENLLTFDNYQAQIEAEE